MVLEHLNTRIKHYIKVSGDLLKMERKSSLDMERSLLLEQITLGVNRLAEKPMMDNGLMTKCMVKEPTLSHQEMCTPDSGKMASCKDRERCNMQTVQSMKEVGPII